jgi:hypothetical protein
MTAYIQTVTCRRWRIPTVALLIVWTVFFSGTLVAERRACITALVADLKVSQTHGIKICEIQTVRQSRFAGADVVHKEKGRIPSLLALVLSDYIDTIWFDNEVIGDDFLRRHLKKLGGRGLTKLRSLSRSSDFVEDAKNPPKDPADLSSYSTALYTASRRMRDPAEFMNGYPGILFIDEPIWHLARSKDSMNAFLDSDPVLRTLRPRWVSSPKEGYASHVADEINAHIGTEYVVVKPLRGTKGRGIIITPAAGLDKILSAVTGNKSALRKKSDINLHMWSYDRPTHFTVEEYASSDPIAVPHLKGRRYDGTMRIVFLLVRDHGATKFHMVDGYWKLPRKSLDSQSATLTEIHKSYGEAPYFAAVEPALMAWVTAELQNSLPRILDRAKGDR